MSARPPLQFKNIHYNLHGRLQCLHPRHQYQNCIFFSLRLPRLNPHLLGQSQHKTLPSKCLVLSLVQQSNQLHQSSHPECILPYFYWGGLKHQDLTLKRVASCLTTDLTSPSHLSRIVHSKWHHLAQGITCRVSPSCATSKNPLALGYWQWAVEHSRPKSCLFRHKQVML